MASSAPLSKENTSFCLDLYKQLSDEDKAGNIFFSPFSISAGLAMVMLGTRGNTHTQMSAVLCFAEPQAPKADVQQELSVQSQTGRPDCLCKVSCGCSQCLKPQDCQDDVHAKFKQLLNALKAPDVQFTLSIANRLYGKQLYPFIMEFPEQIKKYYEAEPELVDFRNHTEEARVNINSWVEIETQGKIKDLLAKDVLDNKTVLVLINAIYFKGKWDKQFDVNLTVDAEFKINKNDTKPVKLMRLKSKFSLATIPCHNCQVLEMPYQGEGLRMIIFLPNAIEDDTTGLERLEKELTYEKFVEWTSQEIMMKREVEVWLPRFKMEETYDLNEALKVMGMVDAFDVAKSDFTGMTPSKNLVLSKVVHKSFVEVNEEGSGALATIVTTLMACSSDSPAMFIADHPFLFFIQHRVTKAVLFAGRFCSPE